MHDIEPYYNWLKYYNVTEDPNSPFEGKQYNYDQYSETIYGYYIDPSWDFMGSETLYIKILFVDYDQHFIIIEFIGEWNDAINNDIMYLPLMMFPSCSMQASSGRCPPAAPSTRSIR